jgi:N-methylhydantoinase B
VAETVLIRNGTDERLGSKEIKPLKRGDIISFRLAGAGGYGDPKKRSRDQLKRDVADGYISAEKAIELYGASKEELA